MIINPKSLSEQLMYTTTRISVFLENDSSSIGTGFFFNHIIDDEHHFPVLITNKHVVEGGVRGEILLHEGEEVDGEIIPNGKSVSSSIIDFRSHWFFHPNDTIDLCAMPINPLIQAVRGIKKIPFNMFLSGDTILEDNKLLELRAVEDVLMVGYPIGLWDSVNNFPLFRRGITATHPAVDFEGDSMTLVDIGCFPGSSGSPVLITNESGYGTKEGFHAGTRSIFLGVLFAGPQWESDGKIIIKDIPTTQVPFAKTPMMIHLGYIVKAREIIRLCEAMVDQYRKEGKI